MAVFEVKTKQSRQTALAAKRHTAERKKKLISKTLQEDIKKRTQQAALNKDKKEKINLGGNKGASTTVTRSNINEIASKGKYSTPTTKNLGSTAKNTTRLVSKSGANAAEGITDSLINVILGTKNPLAYMVNPTTNLGDWFEDTFGKDEKAKLSYKEQQAIGKQNTINETNKLNKGLEIIGRTDLMETVPELTEDEKLHLQIAEHKINMAKDLSKENFKIYQDSVDKNIAKDYTSGWINSAYGGEEAVKKMNEESLITEENFGGQVAQGLGQGLFNLLGGIASGGSNLITGAGIFASASGSSLQEAYQSGAERSDAQKYALMSGGLEAALELATGSIPGLGKNSGLDYLIDEKGIKKISNRFVRELTRFGYRTTGEASEEMLAEFLTPYIQRATYNPNAENATAEQILQAGLSAAIISGVLDGPNTVVNTKQAINDERLKTGIKQNLSPETAASIRADLIKNGMSSDLATELMNESLKEKGLPNIDTVVTDNTINFYGKQLNSKQIKTKLKQLNQLLPTISDQSQLDRIGNAIASLNYANDILNNGVNLVDIETTYGINKSQNISEKTLQKVAAEKQLVHSTQDIDRLLTSELYDGEFGIQMQNQGQRASTYGNAYITLKPGILNYAIKMYEGDGASNREGIVRENTKQYKNMDDVVKNNPKYYDEILTQKNLPVTKFIDKIILPKDSSQETIDAAKKITENIEFIEVAKAQQAVDVSKEAEIKALESQIKSAQKDYEDAPEMRDMLVNELTEKLENLKKEAYKSEETVYNKPTEEGKGVKNENGFRDIQNESRAFVNKEGWGKSSKRLDENLRERLRGTLQQELDSRGYNDSYNNGILKLTGSGNEFTIYENVDGETFHDIFEISRAYTQYGELVDLHDATSDENGTPYSQCDCYISADGMQGFAITKPQKNKSDNAVYYGDLGKDSDTKYSLTDNQGKKLNKALQEIQNKRNNNIELSEKEFYKLYSAHKILVDNEVEAKKIIDSIQKNGFEGNAGFGTNIIPSNIPYDKNGEPVFVGDKKYAPKQGEYVIFVPEAYVDTKDGRYRVEKGFKPKDFEIAKIERNNQPYYELYLKNMTNRNIRYSLSDADLKENANEFGGGDLISVFNMDPNKRGFLRAIESVVREKAKTLDCYVSKEQDLQGMYEKIFGFKTASIMDYNMDYDHDDIAATHNNPQVAFMVNTNKDVKTKHFDKDSYDEAVAYRDSLVDYTEKNKPSEIAEKITKNDDKITVKPDESNIRSWSQTATEGDYEGVDLVKEISGTLDNTYMPEANQKNWNLAVETFDKFGYDKTMEMIKGAFASGKRIKLSDVMLGQKMLQEAAKKGDIENVSFLLQELSIAGTELGQNIQALSVIKKLTPEGQLKVLQKTVDRLKNKFPKTTDDLHLTNEMIDKVLNSETPVDLENNVSEVKELLGQQIKGTFADKMNAWRYFAMLGNPRTHTRNIVSNMTMSFTRGIKNAISRTIETAIDKINPNVIKERSRTWKKASKEVVTYVDDYIKNNKNILSPASKYTIESQIAAEKKAFNKTKAGKALQKMMDFNSDLLDAEDFIFKNRAFKNTVTEYLTANNIRSEEDIKVNPNLFDNAVNYGIEEALKATFQQYSALAETFNSIRNKNKFTAVAMDAVLPFKRTPINIAKTGLAYSPAGLLKTITKNSYDLKKGTINVNQYIDNISQGLTGSMIFLLGYILAENGILTGEPEDTDKEELFEGALGKQNFAINIGGQSFTIDWLTPTSMPLLTGATISNMKTNDNPFNMNTLTSSVTSIFQPLVELSFLQSVDNALSTYSTEGIQGSIEEFMKSYISQYFPTISGQLAKTIDPTIRSSAASKNSPWKFGEEVLRQNMAKIPGLTYLLEPSTDLWGNEAQRSKNVIVRAFENFIAPYSRKSSLKDSVSDELQALYSRTYEDGVIPNLPSTYYYGLKKYVKFDGNQYDMNAGEYTDFKKTYGQTAYKTLESLFKTNTYKNATDEDKVKLVENAYTYAKDLAKKEFLAIKNVEYTNTTQKKEKVYKDNNIKTVIEKDISYDDAKTLKNYPTSYYKQTLSSKTTDNYKKYSDKIDDIKDKYEDSKKRKTEVINYVNGLSGLSVAQKAMLIKDQYSSYTKYDRQIVDYVNKQDLTKSQKNDILESLGFTIKNNRVIFKK